MPRQLQAERRSHVLREDSIVSLPAVGIHLDPSLIETDGEKEERATTSSVNKTESRQMALEAVLHKLWKRVEPEDYLTIPGVYSSVVQRHESPSHVYQLILCKIPQPMCYNVINSSENHFGCQMALSLL